MKINRTWKILITISIVVIFIFLVKENEEQQHLNKPTSDKVQFNRTATNPNKKLAQLNNDGIKAVRPEKNNNLKQKLYLNATNFEELSQQCFNSTTCVIEGKPWELYQDFKKNNNFQAVDELIDYMLFKLKNSNFRDEYKGVLKQMIEDSYPADIASFKMGAYYGNLGDLQTSLDIYLNIEKKFPANNKKLIPAEMGIADAYYKLGNLKESLHYYEVVLTLIESTNVYGHQKSTDFINKRINEIKEKIN